MNDSDTLRVRVLIERWGDERYKQQAYSATRREFWEKLGQALYEGNGIFTVEIDEKRERAMLPDNGEVVIFSARFMKVPYRHVEGLHYSALPNKYMPKRTLWQKIEDWFKKGK